MAEMTVTGDALTMRYEAGHSGGAKDPFEAKTDSSMETVFKGLESLRENNGVISYLDVKF